MPQRKRLKKSKIADLTTTDDDQTYESDSSSIEAKATVTANIVLRSDGDEDVHGHGNVDTDGDAVVESSRGSNPDNGRTTVERTGHGQNPAFELVVLGSGGGPLETDCSGYLLKPYLSKWEDGVIGLEGGSGLAYVFSYLACYLLTHAHLDHAVSLILLSGSVPPRPTDLTAASLTAEASRAGPALPSTARDSRIPVYATQSTLESLAEAYDGKLWPDLGIWAEQRKTAGRGLKRKAVEKKGVGVTFSPMAPSKTHKPLHPGLPITSLVFPVAHGHTAHGLYESSATFLRYDPNVLADAGQRSVGENGLSHEEKMVSGREFLFFGDLESSWRGEGQDNVNAAGAKAANTLNRQIWQEAAKVFDKGDLAGIFIECSYDSSRSATLMYGHLSPPGLYHELKILASFARKRERPLEGLRVYVTHIKEHLVPHPSGKSARELVQTELEAIEAGPNGNLGVKFVMVRAGDRILL